MPVLVEDPLPDSLAKRLTEEQRQALGEAHRGARLAALAVALGLNEADALTQLSEATGLPVASNLEADVVSRGLLPARLVHDYQVIPIVLKAAGKEPAATPAPDAELHLATAWPPDGVIRGWIATFTPRPASDSTASPRSR